MRILIRRGGKVLPLLLFLLWSGALFAEETAGTLELTWFENGSPASGKSVIINGEEHGKTDDRGTLILQSDRPDLQLSVTAGGRQLTSAVALKPGLTTLVIVSEGPEGGEISVEEPAAMAGPVAAADGEKPDTTLRGEVQTLDGEPIAGASVFVRGQGSSARTNAAGAFVLPVRSGRVKLSIVHSRFSTLSPPEFTMEPGIELSRSFRLTPAGIRLENVSVTAPHIKGSMASLIDQRRASGQVTDVIGAEQISRSGDSDAAGALRRVTGLTLVDGKYIYVRGLGERYSRVLLNRSALNGADPNRRVVPLDMFPAGILKSITVQKSYSADLPGGFGGGAVLLETRNIPDKFSLKTSLSTSGDAGSDGRGYTYKGGDKDWLGMDDGTRDLPGLIRDAGANQKITGQSITNPDGYTAEQLQEMGQSLPVIYNVERKKLSPNLKYTFTVGDSYGEGFFKPGWSLGMLYSNRWKKAEKHILEYTLPFFDINTDDRAEDHKRDIRTGLFLNLGADFGENHEVRATSLLLRRTTDEVSIKNAEDDDEQPTIETRLRWKEREMEIHQVRGTHRTDPGIPLTLDWRWSGTTATLSQPDTRQYLYEATSGQYRYSTTEALVRKWGDLEDKASDYGADLNLELIKDDGLSAAFRTGANKTIRKRQAGIRRYQLAFNSSSSTITGEQLEAGPDAVLAPGNIGPDGFEFREETRETDQYEAEHTVTGVYAMFRISWNDWEFEPGIRKEDSGQMVRTFELFNPDQVPVTADLATTHLLPAFNASWKFLPGMQFRLGLSRTVSRPDFKELSAARYTDDVTGYEIAGNPDLKTAVLTNIDMRWEWYPASNESLSLGLFQKEIEDPIEAIMVISTESFKSFSNAKGATVQGIELEFLSNPGRFTDWLEDVQWGGNLSLIRSAIELSEEDKGVQTNSSRPLQGQSPWVLNLFVTKEFPRAGHTSTLLFNEIGKRITDVGLNGQKDIYEMPSPRLDFVASQEFLEDYKVKLKIGNILASDLVRRQDDLKTFEIKGYRSWSLGISASF